MAASLMIMVCGITARSKKHLEHWPELKLLKQELEERRDELISLSRDDADAYDRIVAAMRRRREVDDAETRRSYQAALRNATEVPYKTAVSCLLVLEKAVRVAELGLVHASSDTGVAVLLAEVGFRGAAMNVDINLKETTDAAFVIDTRRSLDVHEKEMKVLVRESLSRLRGPSV